MKSHQEICVNLDIHVAIPAESKEEAFDLLDRLSKKEILMIALAQLPFEESDIPMSPSLN
jgi:hypothetical protein|tara:strand:- start:162 stop:341 length:180 start_codon:yes stop_codon:yes gene_type:complete